MRLRAFLLLAAFALAPFAAPAAVASVAPVTGDVVTLTHVDDTGGAFRLSSARPNPFSSSTRLELSVDGATDLTVAVFDALGRRVALIHEGAVRAGTYALRVDAGQLPPGLYMVRATDNRGATATRSISLVR